MSMRVDGPGAWRISKFSTNSADTICIGWPWRRLSIRPARLGIGLIGRSRRERVRLAPFHLRRFLAQRRIMAIELPPLPYADDALDPHISARTHQLPLRQAPRHLRRQPQRLDRGHAERDKSLEEIIADAEPGGLFNNAAQVWNHTFYWNSMAPSGGGDPSGDLAAAIDASFGSGERLQGAAGRRRARATSAPAGPGSSRTATAWRSSTPTTPTRRSSTARRRCSPSTCGSTRTTSTTRTPARRTSRRSSTSSSTGSSPPANFAA